MENIVLKHKRSTFVPCYLTQLSFILFLNNTTFFNYFVKYYNLFYIIIIHIIIIICIIKCLFQVSFFILFITEQKFCSTNSSVQILHTQKNVFGRRIFLYSSLPNRRDVTAINFLRIFHPHLCYFSHYVY